MSKMTWERKDRVGADQSKLLLHREKKAISIYSAAEEGSGSERPIFQDMGKVLDGAWHKLSRGSLLTVCVYPCQSLQSKEGKWRQCPGKVNPGQCYSLGDRRDLVVDVEIHWISAAKC